MIIDLTHTITPEMPMYPGSAAPSIKPTGSLTRDGFLETQLTIASHTGTHMDAPSHMLPRGSTLEVLPASQFCGRAVVLDVSDLPPRSVITADYLREQNGTIRSADFVLFYTGWERKWGTGAYYDDDFPVPDQEAAKYLVSCGLKGVGTDALSVDTLRDQQFLAHKTLLDGGLVIRNDGMYWNQVILDQEAVLLRPGQEPEPTPHCPDLPGALPFSSESAD